MRKLLLFVIAVALSSLAIAQSDCDGFIGQPNCDTRLDDEVCLFNKVVAHFGDKDSISYTFGQSGVEYFYQGEKLSNWQYNKRYYGERILLRRTNNEELD